MSRWIRLFVALVILGGLLAAGLALGERIQTDPGYVLLAYGGLTVEMSLWTGLAVLVVVIVTTWIVLGLGGWVGQMPFRAWRAMRNARHHRADRRLVEGALWLRRDQPEKALTVLSQQADSESLPALHWLLASEAARRAGDEADSQTFLETAEQLMRKVPKALPEPTMPEGFKPLIKALKKGWREDWVWALETSGDESALDRLSQLAALTKAHPESLALAVVEARLALSEGLEAEAKHHIERASAIDANHPMVLLVRLEQSHGRTPVLEQLKHRLLEWVR